MPFVRSSRFKYIGYRLTLLCTFFLVSFSPNLHANYFNDLVCQGNIETPKQHKKCTLRIYQIMVASFVNGNPDIGYGTGYGPSHHMGDLQGIIQALPYIKSIGYNAIWLTPIFNSQGTERIDATGYYPKNYFKIDPNFGTLEDAKALVDKAHDLGLYVFLDAVFGHHKGDVIPSPNGLKPADTSLQENFGFEADFPKDIPFYKEVITNWMNTLKIDGWRLDQAYQLPIDSWLELKATVDELAIKNGTLGYMVGEIWNGDPVHIRRSFYGSNQAPGMYSAFDYPLRYSLMQTLVTQESIRELGARNQPADKLVGPYGRGSHDTYPSHTMPNFMIGNHDLVRFGNLVLRSGYARSEKDPMYWQIHRTALLYQAIYSGPITSYYGEEIGDLVPDFKMPVRDECIEKGLCDDHVGRSSAKIEGVSIEKLSIEQSAPKQYVTYLWALRDNYKALSIGKRFNLYHDKYLLVEMKQHDDEQIIAIFNIYSRPLKMPLEIEYLNKYNKLESLLDDNDIELENGTLSLDLPPKYGALYILK